MKRRLIATLCLLLLSLTAAIANVNNGETYKMNSHTVTVELQVNGMGEMQAKFTSKGDTSEWVTVDDDPVEGGADQSPKVTVGGSTFQIIDGGMYVMNKHGKPAHMGAPRSDKIEGEGNTQGLLPPARC